MINKLAISKLTTFIITSILILFFFSTCQKEPVSQKIGAIIDLTGPMAINGKWAKEGIDIAYNHLKSKYKNIVLIIEDSQSESKTSVSALQKLINIDKTKIVITANASSSDIMAMAPIAEKEKCILFVTSASSPTIANAGDFIFRNRLSGDKEVDAVVKAAFNRGINEIAFATLNNEAGQAYSDFFENSIASYGLKAPIKVFINIDETDPKSHATKLKDSKAKALFYAGPLKLGVLLMKSCVEIGYNPLWLGISPMRSQELFDLAGDIAEGLVIATEFPDTTSSRYKELTDLYQMRSSGKPNTFTANSYDALNFLMGAIDSVGYEPIRIRDFLYTHEFIGAGGQIYFDKNGDAIREVYLMQVKDSKFVLINN